MLRIPILITLLLALVACAVELYVFWFGHLPLTASELIQAQVGIFATFGALVSAVFVVYSYVQTNWAFVESQRPQLLVQVETRRMKRTKAADEDFPATFIHYKNITANQFADLTIIVHVSAENRSIDLSDLFRPGMVMIGHDQRQRWFDTYKLLQERTLDLKEVTARGHQALLKLSYTYTYSGERKTVYCQEYKWDLPVEQWIIA